MKWGTGLLAFLFTASFVWAEEIKLDDITVQIDQKLAGEWDFSNFKKFKPFIGGIRIEGIVVYKGGKSTLYRWYAYNSDGVKIDDGPLNYQDYEKNEKTKFEISANQSGWRDIKTIKIKAK